MKLIHLFENEVPSIDLFDPESAYKYAKKQGKRIPKLEPIIMKSSWWAVLYAQHVIRGRWLEAEPYIMKTDFIENNYVRIFPELRQLSKDVPLVLLPYAITDVPNTVTDEQVEKLIKLLEPSATNLNYVKQYRTYVESIIKRKLHEKELHLTSIEQLQKNEKEKEQFMKHLGVLPDYYDFK